MHVPGPGSPRAFASRPSPARRRSSSLDVERRIEREAEAELVDELIGAAAGQGPAVCGLGSTIEALGMQTVSTLVLADGLRARGGECPNCGWLVAGIVTSCPACGHDVRADDDVIDLAVRRAFDQGARVEVVHDDAARRLANACHGLGGIVRFRQG